MTPAEKHAADLKLFFGGETIYQSRKHGPPVPSFNGRLRQLTPSLQQAQRMPNDPWNTVALRALDIVERRTLNPEVYVYRRYSAVDNDSLG